MTIRYALWLLFLAFIVFYTFTSLRFLVQNTVVRWSYLVLSVLVFCLLYYFFSMPDRRLRHLIEDEPWLATLFFVLLGFVLMQITWSLFTAIDDVRATSVYGIKRAVKHFSKTAQEKPAGGISISRNLFLQWFAFSMGSFIFGSFIWGMTNKFNYKIRRKKIKLAGLSNAWKGFKLIQISDMHCGSFKSSDYAQIKKGIDMVNNEQANIILFTGDLVNNLSTELDQWQGLFSKLKAPLGVYSILGNHDYGFYRKWASQKLQDDNLNRLKEIQSEMGWTMLNNSSVELTKEGAMDSLTLVGVENWSVKDFFPKYGNIQKAMEGTQEDSVKILMSHDPSHWDAEIVKQQPTIKLTLSGHTHGMQFGLETPFFRWSPVQWIYKQWAGLYKKGDQMLYVNRGFGFLAYPGRVGIMPEITVLELS